MVRALAIVRQPALPETGSPGEELHPNKVSAQHALPAVRRQGVEDAEARKKLLRTLLHPAPGAHLERERQDGARRDDRHAEDERRRHDRDRKRHV